MKKNRMKWYIYLELNENKDSKSPNSGRPYYTRRYYRKELSDKELKKNSSIVKYLGEADLDDDYFIPGSVSHFYPINNLNEVSLTYEASLENGRMSTFVHTFQELLERAKEGILPYISFAEYKVNKKPVVTVKGQDLKF